MGCPLRNYIRKNRQNSASRGPHSGHITRLSGYSTGESWFLSSSCTGDLLCAFLLIAAFNEMRTCPWIFLAIHIERPQCAVSGVKMMGQVGKMKRANWVCAAASIVAADGILKRPIILK